jgi:topoisomerase-4 subunit B
VLRAKAVLCPRLRVTLTNEFTGERDEWFYTGGLHEYLAEELGKGEWLPAETFYGKRDIDGGSLDWAFAWVLESEHRVTESYVNLIPTVEGGTHVNGLRTPAPPTPCASFANSAASCRGAEAHAGRRLGRRELRAVDENARTAVRRSDQGKAFLARVRRHRSGRDQGRFALWLNQHPDQGEKIAMLAIANAQQRFKDSQKVERKRIVAPVPRCRASSPIA